MKRYQQHTHASWHRTCTDKVQCPWCNEYPTREGSITPQHHNTQRKLFAKGSDASRTKHTATPLGHRRQPTPGSPPDQKSGRPLLPQTPESARNTVNGTEASPGHESVDENYAEYNGRTVRHNGLTGAFVSDKPRPPLPAEWTKETEGQDDLAWSGSTAQTPSGLDTSEDFQVSGDNKVDSPELSVKEIEQS